MYPDTPLAMFPIEPLIRAKVFKLEHAESRAWTLIVPGTIWSFKYDPVERRLTIRKEGHPSSGELVVEVDLPDSGGRPYFVCECCLQLRDRLAFDAGKLVCFEKYEAEGSDGHKALRMARRIIAAENIKLRRTNAEERSLAPPPSEAIAMHQEARKPVKQPLARKPWSSTARAIERGLEAGRHNLARQVITPTPGQWAVTTAQPSFTEPAKPMPINEFPELDIRVLTSALLRGPQGIGKATLRWGEQDVMIVADRRRGMPYLLAGHEISSSPIARCQPLPLVRHANGRFSFVCPVTKKNFYVLYFRNGYFASREAHKLYNSSQRAAGGKKKVLDHEKDNNRSHI